MYTEELEGFEEAEQTPATYVSSLSQQDVEKLARENEKLKKSLEKEKFFNKLLDQELKEVKADAATRVPADWAAAAARRGVSSGAFYTVLIFALAMAGFIIYTLYNNRQYNLFGNDVVSASVPVENTSVNEPDNSLNATPATTPPVAKDSVPEIIGTTNPVVTKPSEPVKKEVIPLVDDRPVTSKQAETVTPVKEKTEKIVKPVVEQPVKEVATTTPVIPPAAPSRQVIGHYKVSSKANFYNSADENTLRSAYISGGNKVVDALEDKNGFIYVEYTNENGITNRGWLSKKDLTQE